MADLGWCPFAERVASQSFGYSSSSGLEKNRCLALVDHIMEGYLNTMVSWAKSGNRAYPSSTFGIGRDGRTVQFVSLFDAPWTNGDVERPDPNIQWLYELRFKPYPLNNPNLYTVTWEHEGFTGEAWTPEMYAASLRTKQWVLQELTKDGRPIAIGDQTLIGHYRINSVDRKNCPGAGWPRDRLFADLQVQQPSPEEDLMIRHNATADWWADRPLDPNFYRLDVFEDFKVPPDTKRVRFGGKLKMGRIRWFDGNETNVAGETAAGYDIVEAFVQDGKIGLLVTEHAEFEFIECLGYWR